MTATAMQPHRASLSFDIGNAKHQCNYCRAPAITNLDGDNLCQHHANMWCQSEGTDMADYE